MEITLAITEFYDVHVISGFKMGVCSTDVQCRSKMTEELCRLYCLKMMKLWHVNLDSENISFILGNDNTAVSCKFYFFITAC